MQFRKLTTLLTLLMLLSVLGCGDDSKTEEKAPTENNANNMTMVDAGEDEQDADEEPEYRCPNVEEAVCDGRCVKVLTSMEHCGECDNSCAVGLQTCRGGTCDCLGGRAFCDSRCVDTDFTREHCGECDKSCALSEACQSGSCVEISSRSQVTGVLQETNETRGDSQDCGVHGSKPPVGGLQLNDELMEAAQLHAEDMALNNFMAHEGSDGSSPGVRADRAGYPSGTVGENVARGYETPVAVVDGWTESDGHCNNMMNGTYNEIGIGYAVSSSGEPFWVQLFGAR